MKIFVPPGCSILDKIIAFYWLLPCFDLCRYPVCAYDLLFNYLLYLFVFLSSKEVLMTIKLRITVLFYPDIISDVCLYTHTILSLYSSFLPSLSVVFVRYIWDWYLIFLLRLLRIRLRLLPIFNFYYSFAFPVASIIANCFLN